MLQIRRGVFETNSSSTHSITIVEKEKFQKWSLGVYYYKYFVNSFITLSDLINDYERYTNNEFTSITDDDFVDYLIDNEIYTLNDFFDKFEAVTENYTTKSGDEIVAISIYYYS